MVEDIRNLAVCMKKSSAEDWQFGVALHQIPMHHGLPDEDGLPCFFCTEARRVVMMCLILIPLAITKLVLSCFIVLYLVSFRDHQIRLQLQ